MKTSLWASLLILLTVSAIADDTKIVPKVSDSASVAPDPKGGGDFSGTITAVQNTGNSFTVLNAEGKVKIFSLPDEQKGKLTVGQKVTVSFTEQYAWPLHTRSVTISGQ